MKRSLLVPGLVCVAFAQQTPPPAFEVASVKVSNPNPTPTAGAGGAFRMRGCRPPDPGSVTCSSATMKMLLIQAYEVKNYQIEGPEWINSENYDLMAKIPQGVSSQQVPAMLQALLAERFQVVVHKETKSLPAYEMTVTKGGSKLKDVDPAEVAAFQAYQEARRSGNDSTPPPARSGRGRPMGTIMMSSFGTGARTLSGKMTITQLVSLLSSQLGRPVIDKTDLTGTYEIELSYLTDTLAADPASTVPNAQTPTASIFQALQETLGLKLEAKRMPIEMVVLDSANKIPTEN